MPRLDATQLYDVLCKLTLPGQIDAVILRANLPSGSIAPATVAVKQRAYDVAQIALQGGDDLLGRVADAIAQEAPWLSAEAPAIRLPEPLYENPEVRALAQQLNAERHRRDALRAVGGSTTDVDARILALRRQLREGGRLRAGEALGDGRYLLLELLGSGGFATVWRALDTSCGAQVAIKALHPNIAGDMTRLERFFRGARVMSTLLHEGVVRVLVPQAEDGGHHYFVMELVVGENLHHAVNKGAVTAEAALSIVLRVGEALAAAHARGIVHRDVKPANVLLDEDGTPKLTDFDLVAAGNTSGGTRTGALGTYLFAAPEQMHNAKEADARADVYALGMTALFCIHGKELPFTVTRKPEKVIAGLPVSDALKHALARAIELEPGDRFADASAFCEAWRKAVDPPLGAKTDRLREGAPWREQATGMSLMWVPPGRFLMGAATEPRAPGFDPEAKEVEKPPHEVVLSRGVWMGEHPVTNAEYGVFLATTNSTEPVNWRNSRFNAAGQPVVGVSFVDALAFCAWLTERAGLQQGHFFDLPTEAEWEHAARGSDGPRYPWGNDAPTPERACFGQRIDTGGTVAVGGRPAGKSPFGCQDMAGNVWEWCLDAWRESYTDPAIGAVDPCHGGLRGAPRDVRGGSWFFGVRDLRCACRGRGLPTSGGGFLGFRVVVHRSRQPWLVES